MKRTYQPNAARRKRRHGFLERMRRQKTLGSGSHIVNDRRRTGRKRLSV